MTKVIVFVKYIRQVGFKSFLNLNLIECLHHNDQQKLR